ncbi:MAG: hypothetical protein V9G19_09025 [Tetrasphaera sp.]
MPARVSRGGTLVRPASELDGPAAHSSPGAIALPRSGGEPGKVTGEHRHARGAGVADRHHRLPDPAKAELQRLAPGKIVVLGGPNTISYAVQAEAAAFTQNARAGKK